MTAVKLTDNARRIFDLRYSLKDGDGNPTETPDEAVQRVAKAVAHHGAIPGRDTTKRIASQALKYIDHLLTPLNFVPNSPTWTGAGTDLGQLAACFVLPISDDLGRERDSIFETMKVAALIQQTGGGNGFDFSSLRPKGALIKKSMGRSSGPVSFLKVYDSAFQSVQQGGTRRGANMGILRVDHPDIMEFIDAKLVEGEIANFNISVAVTDEFMERVMSPNPLPFELVFGDEILDSGETFRKCYSRVDANEIWQKLVEGAWTLGDPGVFFVDAANKQNPCPDHYTLAATNPCGEQALPPYSNCCLGAIAVNRFVVHEHPAGKYFDWQAFADVIELSVQFLDDVVDANKYVDEVPELREAAMNERRIGLGIMGLDDLLFDMDLGYDTDEGLAFVDQLMEYLRYHAMMASIDRARTRGSFRWFEGSIYETGKWRHPETRLPQITGHHPAEYNFGREQTLDWALVYEGIAEFGLRNSCQTTIAPTGTTSNFAGLEGSGCEPAFALSYVRTVMQEGENIKLNYLSGAFETALIRYGYTESQVKDLTDRVAANGGSCQGIALAPEIREVFKVAGDILPIRHVYMQAVCQAYVDNAISKTINMPFESTVEDVSNVYMQAWLLGCKGITVYRQGSRQLEVLSTTKEEVKLELVMGQTIEEDNWPVLHPIPMPDYVSSTYRGDFKGIPGRVFEVPTAFGNMQVTITELRSHPGRPFDVRLQIGKAGNDKHADVEAIGRMASVSLRTGVDVRVVVDQLVGIGGRTAAGFGPNKIKSVADGLGKLLHDLYDPDPSLEVLVDSFVVTMDEAVEDQLAWSAYDTCPECKQATVVNDGGCSHCETRLGGCGNFTACD